MFDEDCYYKAYQALDDDFKRGRYYVVSDPASRNPKDRVIHVKSDKYIPYKKRSGSSNNLLVLDDPFPSNGYHGSSPQGGRMRTRGYDDREWSDRTRGDNNYRQQNNYKSRSYDNLDGPPRNSPKSHNFNDREEEYKSSYEYHKKYTDPPRYAREQNRYDSVSSDDRPTLGHGDRYLHSRVPVKSISTYDSESSDEILINPGRSDGLSNRKHVVIPPRSMQRLMDEHVAHSWEVKPKSVEKRSGINSYGSYGRMNDDKQVQHGGYSNKYNDGRIRPVKVERTESSDTSNMSTKDYWEGRWSSGSSDGCGKRLQSVSPSLVGNNRLSRDDRGHYLSTGNISIPVQRSPGIYNEKLSPASLEETSSRGNSRVIYNGTKGGAHKFFQTSSSSSRLGNIASRGNIANNTGTSNEKEFLSKVQQELELQRRNLTGEIDKLLSPMGVDIEKMRSPLGSPSPPAHTSALSFNAEKNSFVDTSGPSSIFKAYVDVSDYPPNSVTVGVDHLGNKVVVEARQDEDPQNHVATSFTQKIPLPRYADTTSITAKVNRKGIIKVEVPLLFYFKSENTKKSSNSINNLAKSFVYEVKTDSKDGSKVMEIVVKPGPNVSINDVRVEVTENGQLTILVEKETVGSSSSRQRRVIKTYSLPSTAVLAGIQSKMANDGTLTISVPIAKSF